MSVSSACSQSTVDFQGQMMDLDKALQKSFDDLMAHMTKVQFAMRQLALAVEQDLEFGEELVLTAVIDNEFREMSWLFDDLRGMESDLISIPDTQEDKDLMKKFKLDQKILEKKLQSERAARFKEERAASKAAMKAEKARIAEETE